jgi:Arylsulfatase A and related enzymes
MSIRSLLLPVAVSLATAHFGLAAEKPNVIVILCDDLGWSDFGCYGGEISTPVVDNLAANGVRFRQFFQGARCSPSRAALLTGLHTPQVAADPASALPQLKVENNVTIAELLKANGYRTYMAGKWHLGTRDVNRAPEQRGFQHVWRFAQGHAHSADNWTENVYSLFSENNEIAPRNYTASGQQFYQTEAIGDYSIDFINHHLSKGDDKPFFLYMAFGAPHFPIQAPPEIADKYMSTYEKGWDVLRQERYARQLANGVIDERYQLTPRGGTGPHQNEAVVEIPAWNTIGANRRADLVRRMSLYAAMIEELDRNIGKVVNRLQETGQLDNTLIFVLSDNGANAEKGRFGTWSGTSEQAPLTGAALANMGQPNAGDGIHVGAGWANLSNTPLRLFKHFTHEGGVRTPCIVHWPAGIPESARGGWREEPGHLIDVMATIVGATGVSYPTTYAGRNILPREGVDLLPHIVENAPLPERPLFIEHEVNRMIQRGPWKLVTKNFTLFDGSSPAHEKELYDLANDPTETTNVAATHGPLVAALTQEWNAWVNRVGLPANRLMPEPPVNRTPAATAGDLFVDTFNRPAATDIDTSVAGAWGSRIPPIAANAAWREGWEGSGSADSIMTIDNVLQMATGAGMSENGLNHNFIGQDILDAGGFSVSLDVLAMVTDATDTANRYVGFGVGLNAAQAAAGNDIGAAGSSAIAFRGNGTSRIGVADCFVEVDYNNNVKVWTGGTLRSTVNVGTRTGRLIAAFECNSFAAGASVQVSVYFNGNRLDLNGAAAGDTISFTWNEANANYIGLSARASSHAQMDNFAVRKLPLADALTLDYALRNGLDGGDTSPTANPDTDRANNRREWAFGTNPATPDSQTGSPVLTLSGSENGLRFSHRRLRNRSQAGLEYDYFLSRDLEEWEPVVPTEISATPVSANSSYEFVELALEDGPSVHDRLFLRLDVRD